MLVFLPNQSFRTFRNFLPLLPQHNQPNRKKKKTHPQLSPKQVGQHPSVQADAAASGVPTWNLDLPGI